MVRIISDQNNKQRHWDMRVLYLVGSTHGLEQELLTTSDDKQEEEVDEVGTKLMDEFMLFLSLKGKLSFGKKDTMYHTSKY